MAIETVPSYPRTAAAAVALILILSLDQASCAKKTPPTVVLTRALLRPEVLWSLAAGEPQASPLVFPFAVAVNPLTRRLYVADRDLPGIAELDAGSGTVLRILGRDAQSKPDFARPSAVAVSPDGKLLAVYDAGRRPSVFLILSRDGELIRRTPVEYFYGVKGLAVGNDTTVVAGGGRVTQDSSVVSITWVGRDTVLGTGPIPVPTSNLDETQARDAPIYAAGGPILLLGDSVILADDGSGQIWTATPTTFHKVAAGPEPPPGFLASVVRSVTLDGRRAYLISRDWPHAALIDTMPAGGYLTAWCMGQLGQVNLYRHSPDLPPIELGSYQLDADWIVRDSANTYIVLKRHNDLTWTISRVRLSN